MSRTAVLTPGRTNKKFIYLAVVLGLLGAILVYAAFSRDSGSSGTSGSGVADIAVVVAKVDIPARTKISQAMVDVKLVPSDTRSTLSFEDPALVIGQVTRYPITANEQVLSSKIVTLAPGAAAASRSLSFTVPKGKRAFAINISDVASAGGLVLPGDYVDIVILYGVPFPTRTGSTEVAENFLVQTIYQNVEVLAVSQAVVDIVPDASTEANGQRVRNSEAKPSPGAATVTLSLTPEQVQRLFMAEANGQIRLAVRPYGEGEERPLDFMTQLELRPQNLPNPFTR